MRAGTLRRAFVTVVLGVAVAIACSGSDTDGKSHKEVGNVRKPAVAGAFYPGRPAELQRIVDGFLDEAGPSDVEGEVVGIISPHAGYVFSGQVAAYAYSAVKGGDYELVFLVGPSHRAFVSGAAVYPSGSFETPLGKVEIEKESARAIIDSHSEFSADDASHALEHSLEVQLPFLQRILEDFKIVPIITRDLSASRCEELGRALAECARGKKALLVASSDLSHYPSYDDANKADNETLESWEDMDLEKMVSREEEILGKRLPNLSCTMCGGTAVMIVMAASKALGADAMTVVKYANSGDITGDKSGVVGYGAAVLSKSSPTEGEGEAGSEQEKRSEGAEKALLSEPEKKKLVSIARGSIEAVLNERSIPDFDVDEPTLRTSMGAFVTLRNRGDLRGCIGRLVADRPLYRVVSEMAVAAATQDHRFSSVSLSELEKIDIEISVLSPMKKMSSIDELTLGTHGILITEGARSGCYLPQVADETGWSKEEFLRHCCADKAGIERDAWKKNAEVFLFTAEVFAEKE
jgi:AmmeMemoRadiSam system protein B/AmmeMemoRadiSam system protein A